MNTLVDTRDESVVAAAATNFDDFDDCDDDCQYIFPQRLMSILSNEKNHDAVCWLPHGRAFIIRNRKLFAEKIMPRFFPRKSKYSSFTRKLNRWNFVRVSSGPELGAYYHEFFLRDKPHLAAQMFCKNARTKIAMATDCKPSPVQVVSPPNPQMINEQPPAVMMPPPSTMSAAAAMQAMPSSTSQMVKKADAAAEMFLRNQQLDPAMQFLLRQQLNMCQEQQQQQEMQPQPMFQQQQQQQQQFPEVSSNQQNPMFMAFGGGATSFGDASFQMQEQQQQPCAMGMSSNNSDNNNTGNMNIWQQIQAQKEQEARMMQLRQLMALNLQRQQNRNRGKAPVKNFRASAA